METSPPASPSGAVAVPASASASGGGAKRGESSKIDRPRDTPRGGSSSNAGDGGDNPQSPLLPEGASDAQQPGRDEDAPFPGHIFVKLTFLADLAGSSAWESDLRRLQIRYDIPAGKALNRCLLRHGSVHRDYLKLLTADGAALNMSKSLAENHIEDNDAVLFVAYKRRTTACCENALDVAYKVVMVAASIILLLLTLHALQTILDSPGNWPAPPSNSTNASLGLNYGLVIDAGSVHTTVNLYSWPPAKLNGTGRVGEAFSCENDAAQGISSFADEPERVRPYLLRASDCLEEAVGRVPAELRPHTPVFLGGTAGMRVLNATRPAAAEEILEQAAIALESLGLMKIKDEEEKSAAIVDSLEEGALGWTTANYLSGAIGGEESSSSTATLGALDWGGASTEITFAVSDPSQATKNVTLFGNEYSVYSSSHLCYGQAEAARRYFVRLVYREYRKTGQMPEGPVPAPCQPKGEVGGEYRLRGEDLFLSICTEYKDREFQALAESDPRREFVFKGQSDDAACLAEVKRTFDVAQCMKTYKLPHCFDSTKVKVPAADTKFLAFSTYWYLVSALKLQHEEALTAQKFTDSVTSLCASDAAATNRLLGALGPEVEQTSCFKGLFMSHLLSEGYHLGRDWGSKVEFVDRVRGAEVGWTLGRMLVDTNALPEVVVAFFPPLYPAVPVDDVGTSLIGAAVLVGFLLIFAICQGCAYAVERWNGRGGGGGADGSKRYHDMRLAAIS